MSDIPIHISIFRIENNYKCFHKTRNNTLISIQAMISKVRTDKKVYSSSLGYTEMHFHKSYNIQDKQYKNKKNQPAKETMKLTQLQKLKKK